MEKVKSQKDYQDLKKAHEAELASLKTQLTTAQAEAGKVPALEAKITQQIAAFNKLKADAMAVITPLRTGVKTMETQITQLEADKADLTAEAAKWAAKAAKATGTPAPLIVPGEVPVPRTSPSIQLTPAPVVPLGPNARARLKAEQVALEAPRTAQEPPKQPKAPTPLSKPEKSLAERIEEWVKGLIERFGKQPSELVEGGGYSGKVISVMDGAWAQKVNRDGDWVVHQGQAPELDSIAEVTFKNGNSAVKGIESGKGGIGG